MGTKIRKSYGALLALFSLLAMALAACAGANPLVGALSAAETGEEEPGVRYTLETGTVDGRMAFIGRGGEIEGIANPNLSAGIGQTVEVTLINGDGAGHDFAVPALGVRSEVVAGKGSSTTVRFKASQAGRYAYECSLPGHREAGMQGQLYAGSQEVAAAGVAAEPQGNPAGTEAGDHETRASEAAAQAVNVARSPAEVPPSPGDRPPGQVRFDMETVEVEGQLADGTTFTYWTFNGQVPGPFLRVRLGDVVELHLKNRSDSLMVHSIDLHAVNGPGGGAAFTQAQPGEEKSFTFKALNSGLYIYHCATPMVAHHIASGMYGLILVEPEGGLPPVDREFYVMQGEIYTSQPFGQPGHQETSIEKLLAGQPEYFVFNGAVGALTASYPLQARTGESVRIFMGVGGPNYPSSFHLIGEIFDRVYDQASLTSAPLTDVQTTLVPPGGATVVEFTLDVPGRYTLVDHALSRAERGLAGLLVAEGPENPEAFHSDEKADGSH